MASQEIAPQNNRGANSPFSMLLTSIRLLNLLSFGEDTPALPLLPLNVLIGANGSGKSNLIEAIALLRSTPNDMQEVLRKGGGVREWVWKGGYPTTTTIEVSIDYYSGQPAFRHELEFLEGNDYASILSECIKGSHIILHAGSLQNYYGFNYDDGHPFIALMGRKLEPDEIDHKSSILAQRRDPSSYPEITSLADWYGKVRIYREWSFGCSTIFRKPQRTDMRTDRLEEDFSNLGLFLNKLRRYAQAKNKVLTHLRDIYEGVDDFDVSIEGGTVQLFFTEGNFTIPATRLSDGTLRYLCLLAILCDPTPPPLICIEEPELGLHPDILPKIADLLVEASERTQLIVTTHSEILVDTMTEHPEAVVVCEKHNGQTQMTRLSADDLSVWLEKHRLGDLWTRGQLGGTRW